MPTLKYSCVRNACFSFGVLVALLCVFPPPDAVHILQLYGHKEIQSTSDPLFSEENDTMKEVVQNSVAFEENDTMKEVVQNSVTFEENDTMKEIEQTGLGSLEIEMELGSGHVFYFVADLANPQLLSQASKFCNDHAEEIGVDVDNIEGGCVEPVHMYLNEQLNAHLEKSESDIKSSIISVDMDVQGSNVHFEVDTANPDSAKDQATTFCTQYGAHFGVTEDTLQGCISSIQQALQRSVATHETELMEHSALDEQEEQEEKKQEEEEEQEEEKNHAEEEHQFDDEELEKEKEEQPEEEHQHQHHQENEELQKKQMTDDGLQAEALNSDRSNQVFVSSFPLGTKVFAYRHILGEAAAGNAASFCGTFWKELEGAFVEAGMTAIDEKTCALIVEEVMSPQVQQFVETLEAEGEEVLGEQSEL